MVSGESDSLLRNNEEELRIPEKLSGLESRRPLSYDRNPHLAV